jgi:hypothetical protein
MPPRRVIVGASTPNAKVVRKSLIQVFTAWRAWRRGQLVRVELPVPIPPCGSGAVARVGGRLLGWCGHRAPLSEAREIGVRFNHELPTGCAEVLSINGSVGAHGGSAFLKNHEALSPAYRHTR